MAQQQQTLLRVQTGKPGYNPTAPYWYSGQTYYYNDLATYSGVTYIANYIDNAIYSGQSNTNQIPLNNPVWWANTGSYEILDTYSSIPLSVTKTYAELQDIGSRTSDNSINVILPGTKKNNRFFENFFDVDVSSLYFNATFKYRMDVLINDEPYFSGYIRLNKISVLDTKIEYDVSLYNTVGNLYGDIGNKLLKDLNFNDADYNFNHVFDLDAVQSGWTFSNFSINSEKPSSFFYPIVHNGYLYTGDTVNISGGSLNSQTRLYTSTSPIGSYNTYNDFVSAGGLSGRINSPKYGLFDNQLKPALSVWNLLKLMFKTYGYSIKSDFFNTPWMKSLYMYGYFSSNETKFTMELQNQPLILPQGTILNTFETFVSETTGHCNNGNIDYPILKQAVNIQLVDAQTNQPFISDRYITSGVTFNQTQVQTVIVDGNPTVKTTTYYNAFNREFTIYPGQSLAQVPYLHWDYDCATNTSIFNYFAGFSDPNANNKVFINDGDFVDFSLLIDPIHKQIDFLSSIAKKFNLVFITDQSKPYEITIEPFEFYIGTGNIWDWTNKLSFDKGFTVEPALNYIESTLMITDLEDGDYGNQQFKDKNNRIYGQLIKNNPTNFKSQEKKIETIFSAEVFRQWDPKSLTASNGNIKIPLGINYAGSSSSSNTSSGSEVTNWNYTGVKTKPKLLYYLGNANIFADQLGEVYDSTKSYKSYLAWIASSDNLTQNGNENVPLISNTIPIGVQDQVKSSEGFENDACCLLFNSESTIAVDAITNTYNSSTNQSIYNLFYKNRVNNLYDPNTRFISGQFYLKLNDYKNLKPNDLIKIKDQYFIWNKIDNYNLTNTELTKVELVQINNETSTYPTRYFKYFYGDNTGVTFTMKTDFTNPNLLKTLNGWSVFYDFYSGLIYGSSSPSSGITSTIYATVLPKINGTSFVGYIPYTIVEITKSEYYNSGYCDWINDTLMYQHVFQSISYPSTISYAFGSAMPTYWRNSANTKEGFNIFIDMASFYSSASTNGITIASSTYYGQSVCGGKLLSTELSENINTQNNDNILTN